MARCSWLGVGRSGNVRCEQQVERQAEQDLDERVYDACASPSNLVEQKQAQRPSQRAGESGDQGEGRYWSSRGCAEPASQCRKGGIVEPETHAQAYDGPTQHIA